MANLFSLLSSIARAVNHPVPEHVRLSASERHPRPETIDHYGLSGNSHSICLDGRRGADIRHSLANGETPTEKFWW